MVRKEMEEAGIPVTEEQINLIAEKRVKEEINRGVQVIQYQVITLMTTNGQAPFITVFMYIDEVPEGQTREDLVRLSRRASSGVTEVSRMRRVYGLHRHSLS